jgi:hypothetical protein
VLVVIGDRRRLAYAAARLVLALGEGRRANGKRDDAGDTNRRHNRHSTREDAIVVRLSREQMLPVARQTLVGTILDLPRHLAARTILFTRADNPSSDLMMLENFR